MRAYYNEIDRHCCDWLQNLMDAGLITPGKIDDRSIADLSPDDCRGYDRCHFFAGIAGWELALSLSGYSGPVWTGSCPCQPFSAAGKGEASSDERHLWPIWFELIKAVRPPVIFGEQVEAAIGWGWLDLVHSDMEPEGYTIRSAVLPACGVGAPHIRQRLWFVANNNSRGCVKHQKFDSKAQQDTANGDTCGQYAGGRGGYDCTQSGYDHTQCGYGELADATQQGERGRGVSRSREGGGEVHGQAPQQRPERCGSHDGNPWSNLIWLPCTDGKQRPTGVLECPESEQVGIPGCTWEPGETSGKRTVKSIIQPLAHGVPARVAKLRAAGNAIVPQVASEFIKASM